MSWKSSGKKARSFFKENGFIITNNGKDWEAEKGNLLVQYDGKLWDRLVFYVRGEQDGKDLWVNLAQFDYEFGSFEDKTSYIDRNYNLFATLEDFTNIL